jgi:transcriptional repressor NrdR
MRCLKWGSDKSSVIDSRSDGDAIRRRRECQQCQNRFTTFERLELSLPMVIKKDERRQPFDRNKIRLGLIRACEKRPVSIEHIDQTVDAIEQKVSEMQEKEIQSQLIGELVIEALKGLDKIAYVRFASVYREFSDLNQFVETLKDLPKSS